MFILHNHLIFGGVNVPDCSFIIVLFQCLEPCFGNFEPMLHDGPVHIFVVVELIDVCFDHIYLKLVETVVDDATYS